MNKMNKINKINKINIYLILIVINLIFSYKVFVVPKFSYLGFNYNYNVWKLVEAIFNLYLIVYLMNSLNKKKISYSFFNILFLVNYLPLNTYYYLADSSRVYFLLVSAAYILILLILKYSKKIRIKKVNKFYISENIFLKIINIYTILLYIFIICFIAKPSIDVLILKNVYEKRAMLKIVGIMKYLIPWQGYIINNFQIVYYFEKKKYFKMSIGIFLQILLYMIFPYKTFLFQIAIVVLSIKLFERRKYVSATYFLLTLGLIFINVYTFISQNILLSSLVIRRALFIPALLNNIFYDYIKNGGVYLYYSAGLIGKILGLKYPYELPFPNYIGKIYFGVSTAASNTGLFADAYVNLGEFGVLIIAIIIGVFFQILDNYEENNKKILFGLYSFIIMNLTNSSLLTWFLTGGGIFPVLILALVKIKNKEQQ